MGGAALGFLRVATASRDDLAALEECIGDRDGLLQQPAGIVTQIDDEALELVAELAVEIVDFLLQSLSGLLVEGGDANIADIVAFHARADRTNADIVAHKS